MQISDLSFDLNNECFKLLYNSFKKCVFIYYLFKEIRCIQNAKIPAHLRLGL